MANLVVLVLGNPEQLEQILEAWQRAGAPGITVLDSTGPGQLAERGLRDDLPLMPSLAEVLRGHRRHHHTLLSLVEKEEVLEAVIRETERLVPFSQPHSGLMFVLPVSRHWGLGKESPAPGL